MKIRTRQDIEAFQTAVDQCTNTVWLMSASGEQYNMKNDKEWGKGLSRLLNDDKDEMEIYASNYHDESVMMNFYRQHCA